ncbi:MAG: VWA domain-containing protein [Acidobacteria bacterium]|nr:MAG: VWA domain-containing protein [Acidobacteriota bacterium]
MKDEGRRMKTTGPKFPPFGCFNLHPLFLVVLFVCPALLGQDTRERDQRIQVDVNLVTLRFTVRDQQGQFLNNLTEDQFRIFENQERKDLAFFDAPSNIGGRGGPLLLAFLLDVSGSTFATRSEEIIAAQTFFDNIQEVTQLGIFGFTDKLIPFQEFTSERAAALKAFAEARQHLGQTAIYDSLAQLIDRINSKAKKSDRKVVILVSDAIDKAYSKSASLVAKARANNITVYTILVPSAAQLYIGNAVESNETVPAQATKTSQEEAFARLAVGTGGKHFAGFETILDFDQTLAQIDDDIYGNLYSLGFYTDNPYLDKRERQIRVECSHSGARVSALFQNLPERLSQKKKYISALFDAGSLSRLSEAGGLQFEEIAAELDILPSDREGGQLGLPFRLKISPYSVRGSRKEGVRTQFGIIGLLLDRQGREVVRLREFFRASLSPKEIEVGRAIIYTNKLMAPPGRYDLRLAVLELASWRVTAFRSSVEIVDN